MIDIGIDEASHKWMSDNAFNKSDVLSYSYDAYKGEKFHQRSWEPFLDPYGKGDIIGVY